MLLILLFLLNWNITTAEVRLLKNSKSDPHQKFMPVGSLSLERICAHGAYFVFHEYRPSDWENQWAENSPKWQQTLCEIMQGGIHSARSKHWMKSTVAVSGEDQNTTPNHTVLHTLDSGVFSSFVYHDICDGSKEMVIPIEPLVGLMRNPFAFCGDAELQARDYMLVNPTEPFAFKLQYPGKRILFDLGTSYYSTGLAWFVNTYKQTGVSFDSIYAWEASPLDQSAYFREVPTHIWPKLHLYNVLVESDEAGPGHPFSILRQIYEHGDFVVFKIDIDGNPELELGLVHKLMKSNSLRHMVAEVFFEVHFDAPEVELHFGYTGTSYPDALQLFQEAREMGMRLHYWP